MARVLHFNNENVLIHRAFGALQGRLEDATKQEGIQLDIANALWAQKGEPFLPSFLSIAWGDYQANVNQADFKTSADAVTRKINRWVAQKTRDKIHDILAPGSVDTLTRLVLANAIYFKGAWVHPFEKTATSAQPFHLSANSQADALLMNRLDDVRYTENTEFQAVELPFSGEVLSMVVLLPRQTDGLGQLEQQLNPAFLAQLFSQMKKQKVEIFLPKFKLDSGLNLKDPLAKMGMPDAFGPAADFSGLNNLQGSLYLSGVFHKAWADFNEEGAEAAAATIAVLGFGSEASGNSPSVFRADHPFIFLIRDTPSGSLLFIGRLADPRASV